MVKSRLQPRPQDFQIHLSLKTPSSFPPSDSEIGFAVSLMALREQGLTPVLQIERGGTSNSPPYRKKSAGLLNALTLSGRKCPSSETGEMAPWVEMLAVQVLGPEFKSSGNT